MIKRIKKYFHKRREKRQEGYENIIQWFLHYGGDNFATKSVRRKLEEDGIKKEPHYDTSLDTIVKNNECICTYGAVVCPGCEGDSIKSNFKCAGCNGDGIVPCGKCGGDDIKEPISWIRRIKMFLLNI